MIQIVLTFKPEVLHEEALTLIYIYKGALKVLLIAFPRWKVLSKLASARRAPILVSWIIHTILDLRILCRWKLKPQKLSILVTGLNQSESTDLISRGHDESCQSNVLEWALKKAIMSGDYKRLPKTWCWKTSWTSLPSDGNLYMKKVGKLLRSELSGCTLLVYYIHGSSLRRR